MHIEKETLQQHKSEYEQQQKQVLAQYQAVNGAIQEIDRLLQLLEGEHGDAETRT